MLDELSLHLSLFGGRSCLRGDANILYRSLLVYFFYPVKLTSQCRYCCDSGISLDVIYGIPSQMIFHFLMNSVYMFFGRCT